VGVSPGTLLVVLFSSQGRDSEFGRETLSRWREPYGMRARLVENEIMEGSSYRYTMALPTADVDAARRSVLES
jgi:hypothetical protein